MAEADTERPIPKSKLRLRAIFRPAATPLVIFSVACFGIAVTALADPDRAAALFNKYFQSIQEPPSRLATNSDTPVPITEPTPTAIVLPTLNRTLIAEDYNKPPTMTQADIINNRSTIQALTATPTSTVDVQGTLSARADAGRQGTIIPVATYPRHLGFNPALVEGSAER